MRAVHCSFSIGIVILIFAAFSGTAASQEVTGSEDPSVVLDKCLASTPSPEPNDKGVIAMPIEKLFDNNQTSKTAEVLCIVEGSWEKQEFNWFFINRATREIIKTYSGGEVSQLQPSPEGKYLAVVESHEGVQTIEVVDLPALVRDKKYESIDMISSYPGWSNIKEWKGDELIVTSNRLLTQGTDLFSTTEEPFSWNFKTGTIVPQSLSLRDPVRYYCEMLADFYAHPGKSSFYDDRIFVAETLASLKEKRSMPCLERALSMEPDENNRSDLGAALREFSQGLALQGDCLSGSAEEFKSKGIVVEPITILFNGGRSNPVNYLLCIANMSWILFDRNASEPVSKYLQGPGGSVGLMRASPDGKYLAIQFRNADSDVADSHYVEVVDLPRLLTTGRYRSIRGFVGSIEHWIGANLEVTSGELLSHTPIQAGEENRMLPLLSRESFNWDSVNNTFTPVWSALQNYPLRYYCEGLASAKLDTRRVAAQGLRLLNDKDGVTCVHTALASEHDEALQRDLRDLLSIFSQP